MPLPSDQRATEHLSGRAAEIVLARKDEILLEWEKRVRERIEHARRVSRPVLVNTLPIFLANLAQALAGNHRRGIATDYNNVAQEHGGERARVTGFGPEQIIEEYYILREVTEEVVFQETSPTAREASIIHRSFDQAIQDAMTAFFLVHGRLRDQFVATLTHDLRNPLGAAKMNADLIIRSAGKLSDPAEQERLRGLALKTVEALKRADRLIQNLLDSNLSAIGERLPLHITPEDMHEIAHAVVGEMSPEARARVGLEGDRIAGYFDREVLWRAFENLISNALKYGDPEKPVLIRTYEKLGRAMLSVHNEGNPIPAEEQELLFQAFRRSASAKGSGKRGWGLGLAQVRSAAEAHGGSLGVDSSPESGTTFTIDIPADARPFQGAPTLH